MISREIAEKLKDAGIQWAPNLSQLLAEIEKRGYAWDIGNMNFRHNPEYSIGLFDGESHMFIISHFADNPEEAAGQALLWILEKEGGSDA